MSRDFDFVCHECRAENHEACVGVPCRCPCPDPARRPNTMHQVEDHFVYVDRDGRTWELRPTEDPHTGPFTISLLSQP